MPAENQSLGLERLDPAGEPRRSQPSHILGPRHHVVEPALVPQRTNRPGNGRLVLVTPSRTYDGDTQSNLVCCEGRKDSKPTSLSDMRLIRLRTPRQWRRTRRTLVVLAMVGLLLVLGGRLSVGIAVFGLALVLLVLLEAAHLRHLGAERDRQQYALLQIRPLMGDLPLELSGWAADPLLLHNAVRLLLETRPRLVVECGSGSSTIVLARCLRALGRGRILSLEHDASYARQTDELLRAHGLSEVATVVTAPLADRELNGSRARWYGPQYEPLLRDQVDVLLVDGPPGNTAPRARYPAVPLLLRHLAPECWVLMDDGDRPDERAIAHVWRDELGATLSYLQGGRGGWLLHRTGGTGQ